MLALTLAWLSLTFMAPQQRGVVSRIALEPTSAAVSAAVTATATGTNPCGAVFIDWGDGTAVTYAISSLPASQTHAYAAAGHYAVVAKGMGNCDGETRTAIDIRAPEPAPPSGEPTITAVDMTPSPGVVRRPVELAVKGRGSCAFSVDFGDGNTQEESGALPRVVKHTYAVADTYVVIVRPSAPCAGKFTQKLTIAAQASRAEVTGLYVQSGRPIAGQPVTLEVAGSGVCRYTIDFGDGNSDTRAKPLPDRIRHNYPAAGVYSLLVTPEAPCTGIARATLNVRTRR